MSPIVNYETTPASCRHWTLTVDGSVATLTMNVNEDAVLREGYKLKRNSYGRGVHNQGADVAMKLGTNYPTVHSNAWSNWR